MRLKKAINGTIFKTENNDLDLLIKVDLDLLIKVDLDTVVGDEDYKGDNLSLCVEIRTGVMSAIDNDTKIIQKDVWIN